MIINLSDGGSKEFNVVASSDWSLELDTDKKILLLKCSGMQPVSYKFSDILKLRSYSRRDDYYIALTVKDYIHPLVILGFGGHEWLCDIWFARFSLMRS